MACPIVRATIQSAPLPPATEQTCAEERQAPSRAGAARAADVMTAPREAAIDLETAEMKKKLFTSIIIGIICALLTGSCAVNNKKATEYSYGADCAHCHGEKLEGNKNTKLLCGDCHDLTPLPVEEMKSEKMKEIVLSEPHVHKTKNMFSNTPSCFLCHRQNDF
jgi:hypothetical protein